MTKYFEIRDQSLLCVHQFLVASGRLDPVPIMVMLLMAITLLSVAPSQSLARLTHRGVT